MKENWELWLVRFIRAVCSSRGRSVSRLPRQWVVEGRIVYGRVPEWSKTFFSSLEREDRFYDCRSLLANAYGGPFPRPKETFNITDIWNLTSRYKYLERVAYIFSFFILKMEAIYFSGQTLMWKTTERHVPHKIYLKIKKIKRFLIVKLHWIVRCCKNASE